MQVRIYGELYILYQSEKTILHESITDQKHYQKETKQHARQTQTFLDIRKCLLESYLVIL